MIIVPARSSVGCLLRSSAAADAELLEMMDTAKYVDPEGLAEPDGKLSHEVINPSLSTAKNIPVRNHPAMIGAVLSGPRF